MQERLVVDIICSFIVVCVLIGCTGTFDQKMQENKVFFLINVIVFVMLTADIAGTIWLLEENITEETDLWWVVQREKSLMILISKDIYYIFFYCLLYLSCFFLQTILKEAKMPRKLTRLSIPIAFGSMLCWGILNYHQWAGWPQKEGGYALQFGANGGGYLIVTGCVFVVLHYRRSLGVRHIFSLLAFMVLPATVMVSRPFLSKSVHMGIMYSLSLLIYFVLVRLENARQAQKREIEMANQRLQTTMRLVQPHFLCNTLNSIYYLCDIDPDMAKEALGDFAHYLRGNMHGITTQNMIPFEEELEHVKYYIHLEQLRFGEDIRSFFDIQVSDFKLPPLSIEPLVENSIKHGLYEKDGGGTIWIFAYASQGAYHIVVEDDGIGFDTSKHSENPQEHLGLRGVRERLQVMCGGTMRVCSLQGMGTIVELVIPRKAEGRE